MDDDIATQLERDLFVSIKYANSTALVELLERALNVVRVAEQRKKRLNKMTDYIERLQVDLSESRYEYNKLSEKYRRLLRNED